jgi:hypothetical protein
VGQIGAEQSQHLLLAAGEAARRLAQAPARDREELGRLGDRLVEAARPRLDDDVLPDRQGREDAPAFWHVADAAPGEDVRADAGEVLAGQLDLPPRAA